MQVELTQYDTPYFNSIKVDDRSVWVNVNYTGQTESKLVECITRTLGDIHTDTRTNGHTNTHKRSDTCTKDRQTNE